MRKTSTTNERCKFQFVLSSGQLDKLKHMAAYESARIGYKVTKSAVLRKIIEEWKKPELPNER